MKLQEKYRSADVFLVEVDDDFALVDVRQGQIVVLNAAGAWVWTRLGTDVEIPSDVTVSVSKFIGDLEVLGLVVFSPEMSPVDFQGRLTESPAIRSVAPLEAAAGISQGDPWAYMGMGVRDIV